MLLKRCDKIQRLLPPNVPSENCLSGMIAISILSAVISIDLFFSSLHEKLNELYIFSPNGVRHFSPEVLYHHRKMAPFGEVLGSSLVPMLVLALIALLSAILLYASFYQGSRSIYLMRRLSDKSELRRRVWTVPLLWAGAALLLTVALFWIFYGSYMLKTPSEVLENHQLLRFWQDLTAGKIGG